MHAKRDVESYLRALGYPAQAIRCVISIHRRLAGENACPAESGNSLRVKIGLPAMKTTPESERMSRPLAEVDPDVYRAILDEAERQHSQLELIASENFVSEAVLQAAGSVFTNKYAEGYPGKRYYGGCEFTDNVENLARERAKKLFGAEHANVQPHSGSQANQAAYAAVLQPGDTILGMNLAHGGHLTHGHKLNFSGKTYNIVPYGVRKDDERIDYDELERLAEEHKPKMVLAGASAYPRVLDFARFREICDEVGGDRKSVV